MKSGTIIRAVIFGCLMASMPALAQRSKVVNLLSNPGFELGTGIAAQDWITSDEEGAVRETTKAYGYTLGNKTFPDGDYALKLFTRSAMFSQGPIKVSEHRNYIIRGMFYHSSKQDRIAQDALSQRGFLRIEWFDEHQHLLREDYTENHNGLSPADKWVPIEQIFVSPASAVTAVVHVQAHGDVRGGSVFADDILFGLLP
ncbi:MAG TPA: hypothetical protein PJ991_10245 [Kiritimatiellia bacterium]|nr:hypothetical protein [Kiritimatiellia bacterium]